MSVFATRGYEGTGTKDIAHAAGVSEALIYGHFESKQALHAALLEAKSGELLRHLRGATAAVGPDDGTLFRLGLAAIFGFADENPVAWRLLFRDAPANPVLAKTQRQVQQATTGAIATLLAERCEFRLPEELGPALAIDAIAALLKGGLDALANWWFDHRELSRDQIVSLMMDVVWTGLDQLRVARRPG